MLNVSFSWDDGSTYDLKLAEYFMKYNIPCKLFVPTSNLEGRNVLTANQIRELHNQLITFGGHTNSHVYLTQIPLDEVNNEVTANRLYLENIIGQSIQHFCLPGGKYNNKIIKTIGNQFKSIRTADTMCSNFEGKLRKPTFHFYPRGIKSLIRNAVRHYDKILPVIIKASMKYHNYFDILKASIAIMNKNKTLYKIHIWGHSWEIEELQLWEELDEMLKYINTSFPNAIKDYNNHDSATN